MIMRMRNLRSTLLSRVAFISLAASLAAACSSATERFGEAPIYTGGTANQRDILSADTRQPSFQDILNGPGGTSAGLPPATSAPVTTGSIPNRPKPVPVASAPISPTVPRQANVSEPRQSRPVAVLPSPEVAAARSSSWRGWSSAGGTQIPVRTGDTVHSLSRRYGVPVKAIVAVNGIEDPARVLPGQTIIIPTYVHSETSRASSRPAPQRSVRSGHVPVPGAKEARPDASIITGSIRPSSALPGSASAPSRKPLRQPTFAEIAGRAIANDAQPARVDLASPKAKPQAHRNIAASVPPQPVVSLSGAVPEAVAVPRSKSQEPRVSAITPLDPVGSEARPTAPIERPKAVASPETAQSDRPLFRWPVRGRIISDFGTKPGGTRNDGVNLAVPEGTPVKAADGGTVIYSGNELKGYGNLILLRHEDGWVSAYAHNSKLNVKRGDEVSRGDVIANAGASGSVSQPQVHFELRKGNKPVDPRLYLPKI